MTILLFDVSLQVEALGDACLVSILSMISSMLHLLLDMIPKKWISAEENLLLHQLQKKNHSITV